MPYHDGASDRHSTNILRASVLDVFRDLGALEDDSVVKAWILDGPASTVPAPRSVLASSADDAVDINSAIVLAEDSDSPIRPITPKVNFTESPRHIDSDSGSDTDTDSTIRRPRGVFKNVVLPRPFRIRSKSRPRGSPSPKSKAARAKTPPPIVPAIPSSSGYETDEGYTSASSMRRRNVLSKKRKAWSARPQGRDSTDTEGTPLPLPSPSEREHVPGNSGTFSRFFRPNQHSRKPSGDVASSSPSSPSSFPRSRSRGSNTGDSSLIPGRPVMDAVNSVGQDSNRLLFSMSAESLPRLRSSRSAFNVKRLAGLKVNQPLTPPASRPVPPSPFILVAPYGEEDRVVRSMCESGSLMAAPPSNNPKPLFAPASAPPSAASHHPKRKGVDGRPCESSFHHLEATEPRRHSLDSALRRMQDSNAAVVPPVRFNDKANQPIVRKDMPTPSSGLAPLSKRLLPPPRLRNPDASRFAEMDLDD